MTQHMINHPHSTGLPTIWDTFNYNKSCHNFEFLVGSWLQTPRWYNYRKSVEPLFAYSFNRGSSKTFDQEQTMNAHADMLIVVKHNEKYIPRGIYRSLALGS